MTEPAATQLHMVQLELPARGLTEIGQMLGLPLRHVDTRYLVHCALRKLFQGSAPQPFDVHDPSRDALRVLGYSNMNADALQRHAQAFAEPAVYQRACHWQNLASKPMPQSWRSGRRVRFEARVCPVIRKSSDGPRWRAGQELDAFLARAWSLHDEDEPLSRESIYRDWLHAQLDIRGGASLVDCDLIRFDLARMTRRDHSSPRQIKQLRRPDATLRGVLEIQDEAAFNALIRRGVGRHRAFGYGMLKLRA